MRSILQSWKSVSAFARWLFITLFLAACLTAAVAFASAAPLGGETVAASEEEVRAAFLFQLAQYVHWPDESLGGADASLRFCVVGHDKLTETLEPVVRGKSIQGRRIAVQKSATAAQMSTCHLVFVAYRNEKQVRALFANWNYPPVLLVGEMDRFAELGGMVNLVIRSGRVSFEINTRVADRAHLEFRSQLLRFARIVPERSGDQR